MAVYQASLFIFRRDLRLTDNSGLNAALAQSERVVLAFVFDPRQIEFHPYQSQPGLQFMLESLQDLQRQVQQQDSRLLLFNSLPDQVIAELKNSHRIEAVFVNRDYTPFSRQRDLELQQCCQSLQLDFHSHADALLTEPEHILKADGQPFQVFTPFFRRACCIPPPLPSPLLRGHLLRLEECGDDSLIERFRKPHQNGLRGGRDQALVRLAALDDCRDYAGQRDYPAEAATSRLSAYLKFGCCSVRELYHAIVINLGVEHPLLRQLYWRDFFSHIGWHFPHVFGHAFHRRYDAINWKNDPDDFQRWSEGQTGFPIVDAGMRELNQTGLMHNRVRMIVASFLVKDLHISWRWGERYFARHLLDYDPCLNNGNWQWAASTGCDAQPYFRIFNPWLQQQKFDPDCVYIKRWLPELGNMPPKIIHHWYRDASNNGAYPVPMLDHRAQSQYAKALYKNTPSS